ncbi:alpha/beta fold hydrolase [Pseudonocardia sp. CA-142604]|uniref:alpha/beta fold hydrolase n=1 Tax=Pseudonocardia sp. CA-142604 TaxID=3240024 RepID=UPI003D8FE8DA
MKHSGGILDKADSLHSKEVVMVVGSTGIPGLTVHGIRGATRIAARTGGHGPAVLLLHGVGTASASFWAQFDALSATFQLIAWDAFGYGRSSDPPIPVRLDDYADAAADLLDAHGRYDAHVVGVSWGGVVATRLALRHPERVRTLALVASTYGRGNDEASHEQFVERIASLRRDGVRMWAQARVDRQVSPEAPPELRLRIVDTAVASVRIAGFAAAMHTMADTDHRARLGAVRAPTIVLCGDRDPITGPVESRVLAEGISGADLVLVPGGGHLLNQDKPAAVNVALQRHWHEFDGHEGGRA